MKWHLSTLFGFCALATPGLAQATQPCAGVQRVVSAQKSSEFRLLLSHELPQGAVVHLEDEMQQNKWVVLFATSDKSERGVYFYKRIKTGRLQHITTWGGTAAGDSAQSIANWTRSLDNAFPRELALCFAKAVVQGE